MILGEIVIDEAAIAVVDHGLFMQRHADAADHGAHDLAVRGLGIEDAAGGHGADHARDAEHAELLVEPHLGEHRRMDFVGVSPQGLPVRHRGHFRHDGLVGPAQHFGQGQAARRIARHPDLAIDERHVGQLRSVERRILDLAGALEQLLADAVTSLHHRRTDRRRGPRSAFDRRRRQV